MKVKIYGLLDPRTDKFFYVGATSGELKTRLSCHTSRQTYIPKNGVFRVKNRLIKDIIKNNLRPVIIGFTEIPFSSVDHAEKFYFKFLKNAGHELHQREFQFCYTINKKPSKQSSKSKK